MVTENAAVPRIAARPTIYRGIRMRSRLEARFAGLLDQAGYDWEYEPECFASGEHQWLPDFRVGGRLYVEVKPYLGDWCSATGLQRWAEVLWASDPLASVLLWTLDELSWACAWWTDPVGRQRQFDSYLAGYTSDSGLYPDLGQIIGIAEHDIALTEHGLDLAYPTERYWPW